MHDPFLLEACAFHLAERWLQRECPDATPAEAERWATRYRHKFYDLAAQVLGDLDELRAKQRQALRGLPR